MSDVPDAHDDPLALPMHDNAADLIVAEGEWFARTLAAQSRIKAALDGVDEVQTKHVRSSSDQIVQPGRPRPDIVNVIMTFVSILAGLFWPLVWQEATKEGGPNVILLVLYAVLGGMAILVVLGFLFREIWAVLHDPAMGVRKSRPTQQLNRSSPPSAGPTKSRETQ